MRNEDIPEDDYQLDLFLDDALGERPGCRECEYDPYWCICGAYPNEKQEVA